jgi:predicted Zn-dependent peptidase
VTPAGCGFDDGAVTRTVLPSGIRVVTERLPEARSVTVGFWVRVGSRDEPASLAGASHFLEHLLFKGTPTRSARSIAVAVDAVGGEMNAYTTREYTVFHLRLPASELDFGLSLLAEVVAEPAFRPAEIDAEREVILEELLMNADAPEDVVMTALQEALFPGHPLGREILGSTATVEGLSRADLVAFHAEHFRPANLVVAAAGDLVHERVVESLAGYLEGTPVGSRPERVPPASDPVSLSVVRRPTEQAHVAMGWRALRRDDPACYALSVANQVLGGGLSSRLFQEVREERGLAYTVFSSPSAYQDTGMLCLYAGTAPGRTGELVDVVEGILEDLLTRGVTEEEHRVALGCLEGAFLLGLEDSASRMARLGGDELTRDEVVPLAEHLARLRAVTREDVHAVLRRVLEGPRSVAVVGPFDEDDTRLAAVRRDPARSIGAAAGETG